MPVSGLTRLRDLLWLDGPLLTEYVHPQGDHYLYCWSDCDDDTTRWMVLRVSESNLLRLAHGMLPLDMIVPGACQDDFVYFVDVKSGKKKILEVKLSKVSDIPAEYLPQKGVFLDESEFVEDGTYSVMIDEDWDPTELFRFPKDFEQAYSFMYAHARLQVQKLEHFPWKGGFSAMHFDKWVRKTIPSKSRLGLTKMSYASPGFITFAADDAIADMIARCVIDISERETAHIAYRKLSAFMTDNDLRKWERHDDRWPSINTKLTAFTDALTDAIGVNGEILQKSAGRPFEAAQVARWFYRRLGRMASLRTNGKLEFSTGPATTDIDAGEA